MTTWWRRNRLWIALLIPSLVLAIALSSFRWTTLYQPWEWSAPTTSDGPTATLRQTFLGLDDKHHDRTVQVTVRSVEPVPSFNDEAAVAGAVMWRVDLEFEADPDQVLTGSCRITLLDADGTEYGYHAGRRQADPDGLPPLPKVVDPQCVPEDTPGPDIMPVSGEVVDPETARPRTWQFSTSIVIPEGVTPERLRIGWTQPEYLDLRVPR